jgi:hypothetical protein
MKKTLRAVFASILLASTLAGCIIVPLGGPGYHHHERYYD